MLAVLCLLLAIARGGSVALGGSVCRGDLVLSLPLAAKTAPESIRLGQDRRLSVEPSDGGWELEVSGSDAHEKGNLLSPIENWHGAQPFMVTASMADIYPDERVVPIRGTSQSLCIRILDARVERDGANSRYVAGTAEVRWFTPRTGR